MPINYSPTYDWICFACHSPNTSGLTRCQNCLCPASVGVDELLRYQRQPRVIHPKATAKAVLARNKWEARILLGGSAILITILALFLFFKGVWDSAGWGQLGDFVGGYIATFFILVSVVFLSATFRAQDRSTKEQSFSERYFELLKMHRDNVAEFDLGKIDGRKTFVSMVREFQEILRHVRIFAASEAQLMSKIELASIAYYIFYFGVGPNSTRMLIGSLQNIDEVFVYRLSVYFAMPVTKEDIKDRGRLDYEAVDGHQSRLGHYYRHLFQTVNFVHEQKVNIDRYDYIKTIRAQLTNYEQAMLVVNCITPLGRRWLKSGLIQQYQLVRNVPKNFFNRDTELDLDEVLGDNYPFEWRQQVHLGAV